MSIALIAFLIVFILIFVLKIPIPFGLMASCMVYFLISGTNLKMVATQTLGQYYTKYTILAVPLFIFAANVMNNGKITDAIFDFSTCIVGRLRGGLAHVNIMASLIFSGMTGSAIADAAGLGKMEISAMRNAGYDDGFSCAITASSATIGPIFPPSLPMVAYAMISSTSLGALFMGGMIPGVLLAVGLMIYVAIVAKKRNYPRSDKITFKFFLRQTIHAIPALMTPVILLAGIYTGVMTPTEAGAVAGLYALIVSIFVYRSIGWEDFKGILVDTVNATGTTALMLGAAASISYIIAREQIAVNAADLVLAITSNRYVFLMIVNILFLILGCFIDTSVIILVFVPIVLPIVQAYGIDLIHFGLVIVFNMMLGLSTPPFGMLLFITSGVSGTPLKDVIRETLPVVLVMLVVLIILTYIPDVVLILPRMFMGYTG